MKPIRIKIKNKTYRLKPQALITLLGMLALILVLMIVKVRNTAHIQEQNPTPTAPSATYDASAGKIEETEYVGTILAKTEDAGQSYIENTLFLGDSNTARFLKVTDQNGKTFTNKNNTIGVVGMGIDAISSLACMDFSTGRMTMPQAVTILQPQRIIITMGTNNLSGNSTDTSSFIERYEAQLKKIQEAYPYADLIVNSIPPVAKNRSYTNVTMTQIDAYNRAIVDMCSKNDWKYLNSAEALKNEKDGYAKEGYTISDGLHLSSTGLEALFTYIRTHSYISEDTRPKPLKEIPSILGVPDGLIRTDPLTEEEFSEDPSEESYEEPVDQPTAKPQPDEKTRAGCEALNKYWYNNTCNDKLDPNTKEGCEALGKVYEDGVCKEKTVQQTQQPEMPATTSPESETTNPAPSTDTPDTQSPATTSPESETTNPAPSTDTPAESQPPEAQESEQSEGTQTEILQDEETTEV